MDIKSENNNNFFLMYIKPYKGILWFLFLFLLFELIWKICVHLGEDGEQLIVLGHNLTGLVYPICRLDAMIVHWFIHSLLGYSNYHIDDTLVYFVSPGVQNLKINIIWSCTSIKQVLLFVFVMSLYFGPWKKKIYFVPLSLIFLCGVNILRLVLSAFLVKDGFPAWFIPINEVIGGVAWEDTKTSYWLFYKDWYHFFHDGFFKWVYYDGIMFLLWLYWQEKINIPFQTEKEL